RGGRKHLHHPTAQQTRDCRGPHGMRLLGAGVAVLVVLAGIGPDAIAASSETCESHGITYNCVTQSVEVQSLRPAYVGSTYGATNLTNVTPSYTEWPAQIAPGRPIPPGIHVAAQYEHLARLYANNASANESWAEQPHYATFTGLQQLQA